MLFSLGSLRFQFEPDFRDSVGFCSYWSTIHINLCIFGIFWKIEISGYMEAEYVGWPKNAPKIFLGDNRFCSIYEPQNVENHHFREVFESFEFQLLRISIWAKSDRISKIWLFLKSERSFDLSPKSRLWKILAPAMPKFRRHIKNVKKIENFFRAKMLHVDPLTPNFKHRSQ